MEKEFKYPSSFELLKIIANSEFRPFLRADWYSFAGCASPDPLLHESEEYVIVIDGDEINMCFVGDETGGHLYRMQQEF